MKLQAVYVAELEPNVNEDLTSAERLFASVGAISRYAFDDEPLRSASGTNNMSAAPTTKNTTIVAIPTR